MTKNSECISVTTPITAGLWYCNRLGLYVWKTDWCTDLMKNIAINSRGQGKKSVKDSIEVNVPQDRVVITITDVWNVGNLVMANTYADRTLVVMDRMETTTTIPKTQKMAMQPIMEKLTKNKKEEKLK